MSFAKIGPSWAISWEPEEILYSFFFLPSGEQPEIGRRFRVAKKKITTDNIIHVSSVEFHEELNGTTPGAVKVGPKKRTQKNCKIQPKTG